MAAALIEMVCNLTIGRPAAAEHESLLAAARDCATALRAEAVTLAAADASAFQSVIDAYRLPKESDDEKAARGSAIQVALIGASAVPRRTAEAAIELLDLAEAIVPIGNVNVISDAAAAAGAARAAIQTALLNIDANRVAIDNPSLSQALGEFGVSATAQLARADAIVAAARERSGL